MREVSRQINHEILNQFGDITNYVIIAKEDPNAKCEYGRRLSAVIPGARYEEIEAMSHAVTIESATDINQKLMGWFNSVESTQPLANTFVHSSD